MFILGTHSDAGKGILSVPKLDLLYHTAFIGQSGSGKSFAISRLIEEIVLRTRARIIVLDPNGDFGSVYRPREENFWTEGTYFTTLAEINNRTSSKITHYDQMAEFEARWNAVKFQFIAADRNNWIPFREGANAAPLKLHWKWLPRAEQDFLLSVDATQYPTIDQGISTCYHYIKDHEAEFQQKFSLADLEDIALKFATKQIAMAPYPEAFSLSDIDWLSVRLQFRSLRKKFYRLWYRGKLEEKDTAPSDLTNYLHNGFWSNDSWQMCVVGLAGLDPVHMHLAADVTLSCLWEECMNTWRLARQKAFESHVEEMNLEHTVLSCRGDDEAESTMDRDDPADDTRTKWSVSDERWQDRRVPTFLVIDEAQNFAPSQPSNPLQERTSEKIAAIAAEGRKYGLFVILATQRPQKLRNGLLSECENACLLRIQSKLEQKFAADAFGEAEGTVSKVSEFDAGEALMIGRWAAGTPRIRFAPARVTLGGGGLDKTYWQHPG